MQQDEHPASFEDFDKRLPENCVEYLLFLVEEPGSDRRRQLSKLEEVRKSSLKLCQDLVSDYIWQRDEFNLELKNESGELMNKPVYI